jgi:hypothetical protein
MCQFSCIFSVVVILVVENGDASVLFIIIASVVKGIKLLHFHHHGHHGHGNDLLFSFYVFTESKCNSNSIVLEFYACFVLIN